MCPCNLPSASVRCWGFQCSCQCACPAALSFWTGQPDSSDRASHNHLSPTGACASCHHSTALHTHCTPIRPTATPACWMTPHIPTSWACMKPCMSYSALQPHVSVQALLVTHCLPWPKVLDVHCPASLWLCRAEDRNKILWPRKHTFLRPEVMMRAYTSYVWLWCMFLPGHHAYDVHFILCLSYIFCVVRMIYCLQMSDPSLTFVAQQQKLWLCKTLLRRVVWGKRILKNEQSLVCLQ